jgi:hypothetical protein
MDGRPQGFDMVTVALCTPNEFPGELGDDYAAACAALDLPPAVRGYA